MNLNTKKNLNIEIESFVKYEAITSAFFRHTLLCLLITLSSMYVLIANTRDKVAIELNT